MSISETREQSRSRAGAQRIERIREAMREQGVEVLLAFGSGRHHFIGTNACWWLSGVRQLGRDAVVAIPLAGEPQLVVTPAWDSGRATRQSWLEQVTAVDDLAAELPALLRRNGWTKSSLGVAGVEDCSEAVHSAIAEVAPGAADLMSRLVEIGGQQDEYAISCVRSAVEIAEAGYARLLEIARPGVPEYELAAAVDTEMRSQGADDNFLLVSASQHNRAVHAPTERLLEFGDVILAEISPSVDGQFAQICRSAVIGPSDQRQRDCFGLLGEAFEAGLAACRPGVTVPELADVINRLVSERGYGRYTKPPYMRSRGHSMGLGPLVPQDISERSEVALAPGMTFVLHPNQYLPEAGYFLCGDQVLITEDGAEALSTPELYLHTIEEVAVA
jgi:Xaa-Pro dipeptidase